MNAFHRYGAAVLGVLVLGFTSGCFLFGGKKEANTLEGQLEALTKGQEASARALDQAGQALEEGNYDNAVINYNRAIQADSSNVNLYLDLASIHQQLALQRRDEGNIEGAIQENQRALKVLSTLISTRLKPAAERGEDLSALGAAESGSSPADSAAELSPEPAAPVEDTAPPESGTSP